MRTSLPYLVIHLVVILLSSPLYSSSQATDSSVAVVRYSLRHITDSTAPGDPRTDEMVLFLGKKSSFFTLNANIQREIAMKELVKKNPGMMNGFALTLNYGVPFAFYKDVEKGKIVNIAMFNGQYYMYQEEVFVPDWKTDTATRIINGYKCQRATAPVRGRQYEAWFCSDLPFSFGPWKLGGLPGLILEASDTKKEVVFSFISFTSESTDTFGLPLTAIQTSRTELQKAANAALLNAAGKISLNNNSDLKIKAVSEDGKPFQAIRMFNNPIEKTIL
ncbi:GLPGLI family protein [Sediminibacterium ginsengisoli]|uniref:GLPGLI family protein n=1 Tax=Sediminibacterium ginsengisoli TaxID=413434 RepID=A0A1T4LK69_9BACT|nr:GLPGLI family protein [Sediminibacterium ginsengisoli]SJZ54947.1 GLPGLI family protein [Sediminibacterium ginsengisoli]